MTPFSDVSNKTVELKSSQLLFKKNVEIDHKVNYGLVELVHFKILILKV